MVNEEASEGGASGRAAQVVRRAALQQIYDLYRPPGQLAATTSPRPTRYLTKPVLDANAATTA
jgi:hypothetical protein